MHPIKKIYCRAFQTVFRIALPILPYTDPKILEKTTDIPALLASKNKKAPLIVTDKSIRGLGLTKPLEEALMAAGMPVVVYDEILPNPTTAMVDGALAMYQENHCDAIIAYGGGSPMDCAKAVGARVARPRKKLKKMAGLLKVMHPTPPIVAVPTTAGTGSETTLAAVIVDSETRHKYVCNDFFLIPRYAVLDAANIHTLPHSIAATTGMDALTHAVEAYIGRSTTKKTRSDAIEAVKLIFANIEASSNHESDAAEANMMRASHLAGRAFTRSYVGYVHAVSHSLSGKYDMPHGLTNAILLPITLELYGASVYKKLAQLCKEVGLDAGLTSEEEMAKRFIQAIYDLNASLNISRYIEGIIKEEDLDELAAYADKEGNPLYPVPLLWDKEELKAVYLAAKK